MDIFNIVYRAGSVVIMVSLLATTQVAHPTIKKNGVEENEYKKNNGRLFSRWRHVQHCTPAVRPGG
ncbi:hypothetical protein [Marinobacterium nitratireducens]|uniref:hypothetical protein n=1 Tax=Marinobacterium nitratireducens TaxID=518897 RepID=UPI0016686EA4|nr:hypothetical protein [Marinobacterium nitratireducens]